MRKGLYSAPVEHRLFIPVRHAHPAVGIGEDVVERGLGEIDEAVAESVALRLQVVGLVGVVRKRLGVVEDPVAHAVRAARRAATRSRAIRTV